MTQHSVIEAQHNNNRGNDNNGNITGHSSSRNDKTTWIEGVFGCMQPVLELIAGKGNIDLKTKPVDTWIIPFDLITDLEWLGKYKDFELKGESN